MTDDAKPGDPKLDPDAAGPSRRDFLRLGGAAATGAVVGGAAGYAAATAAAGGFSGGPTSSDSIGASSTAAPPASLPPRAAGAGFDHLVVVMFENRSFDNLLGYLYTADEVPAGQRFAGLHEAPRP